MKCNSARRKGNLFDPSGTHMCDIAKVRISDNFGRVFQQSSPTMGPGESSRRGACVLSREKAVLLAFAFFLAWQTESPKIHLRGTAPPSFGSKRSRSSSLNSVPALAKVPKPQVKVFDARSVPAVPPREKVLDLGEKEAEHLGIVKATEESIKDKKKRYEVMQDVDGNEVYTVLLSLSPLRTMQQLGMMTAFVFAQSLDADFDTSSIPESEYEELQGRPHPMASIRRITTKPRNTDILQMMCDAVGFVIPAERRAFNITGMDEPLTAWQIEEANKALQNEMSSMEYLDRINSFQREKVFAMLDPQMRNRVRIWTWDEVEAQLKRAGLPTHRLKRHLIGHGRTLMPRNKYLDAHGGEDLLPRKNDSDATIAWKKIRREDVIQRGLLKDTLNIDLKEIKKKKLMKELKATSEKDFKLKLKERKLFRKRQAAILSRGQRGVADKHIADMRPKHLNTGKMKPWKKTRGRGYRSR
eukprot:jgi/Bigna1/70164/fgenesh1_pg.11_\